MRRLLIGVAIVAAVVGFGATAALAQWVYAVAYPDSPTFFPAGTYYSPNNYDNCVVWSFEIQQNDFLKGLAKLGRSAVIRSNGNWVASAADSTLTTIAIVPLEYRNVTKKGYIANISSTGYYGQGAILSNIACV
jgi:hypothetical protein